MNIERRAFLFLAAMISGTTTTASAAGESATTLALLPEGGESLFARVNGVKLHYVRAGAGPAVILLHGWPQTWLAWRNVMERLASRFTLIAPDLRGLGLSERPATGYDKKTITADIHGLINEVAGGRAHVVGHDMGGKAAFMLGQLHPESVEKLVLVDCLIPGTENMDASRGGAWHYGFHMAPEIPEMLTQGRERDYIAAQIRAWSHKKEAVSEAAISEFAKHYATEGGMTAGFNYYRALRDDAAAVASFEGKRLQMPVMAIAGRYGVGTRLADALKSRAVNLTSVIAEDSGHFVAEEASDFFCEKLQEFFSA
jgi:pimeloyl-ACP methyl ester carboxylesterase